MKYIFTLFALSIALSSFAPKGDKDNFIEIKGKQVAKFTKESCFLGYCSRYEVSDLSDKLLFSIEGRSYNDPMRINKSNPEGKVSYSEWVFYESKIKVETANVFRAKDLSEYIEKNKLMNEDGTINKQGLENFELKNGKRFTEERDAGKGRTIIIK